MDTMEGDTMSTDTESVSPEIEAAARVIAHWLIFRESKWRDYVDIAARVLAAAERGHDEH